MFFPFVQQLQLAENYKEIFYQIQWQLQSKQPALYLFKNIARIGSKGSQMLRLASSALVDALNDDYTIAQLLPFTTKTETQVTFHIYSSFSLHFLSSLQKKKLIAYHLSFFHCIVAAPVESKKCLLATLATIL